MRTLIAFLVMGIPSVALAQNPLPPAASTKVDYDQNIRPLLSQNCYSCHGPEVQQSGLRLDLRQNALRGGDYGPVILPGNSAESKLIRRVFNGDGGLQMPPTGALTDEEIGLLRAWIDQGAEFRTEIAEEAPPKPVDPKLDALVAAVRSDDRRTVEASITSDPDLLKAKDPAGSTVLHHAAGFASLDTVKLLIDKGADVNARNRRGSTPLLWAIHDESKVRLLVARGAAVNVKQVEGRTAVYQAAILTNGAPVVRFLLENGADPRIATLVGQTPLMAAALRADVAVMRLLMEKGADVNARNGAGETALMMAATNGSPQAVKLLLDTGADATLRSKRNETALGNAGTAGVSETIQLLLDHGADVNVRNIRGYSPLMLAASSDALPRAGVKMLLDKGADASYSADYDETALILASKRGSTDVARLLGAQAPANLRPAAAVVSVSRASVGSPSTRAVERALVLLEKQSYNFIRIGGCNSCHSQDLPSAAAAFAREHGIAAPSEIAQLPASMLPSPDRVMDLGVVGVPSVGWELFDLGMNRKPKTAFTDGIVRYLKAMQNADGGWSTNEGRRPPMNSGDYQAAALAVYALTQYGPMAEAASTDAALLRAAKWFEKAKPTGTQDRAFHLLGLVWTKASPAVIKDAARALAAMQRADGGWSQMPTMSSDAYATGQVLYALSTAKTSVTHPVYRRGVEYLLRTQAADGTWHVETRSIWLQPYFESGFPYARDQFISTAGTAWAAMGLTPVADEEKKDQPKKLTQR